MYDRGRGILVSLTLVTLAALMVAFGSSAKAKSDFVEMELLQAKVGSLHGQLTMMQQKVQDLRENRNNLQGRLHKVERVAQQQSRLTQDLRRALKQEQLKNYTLQRRLEVQVTQ